MQLVLNNSIFKIPCFVAIGEYSSKRINHAWNEIIIDGVLYDYDLSFLRSFKPNSSDSISSSYIINDNKRNTFIVDYLNGSNNAISLYQSMYNKKTTPPSIPVHRTTSQISIDRPTPPPIPVHRTTSQISIDRPAPPPIPVHRLTPPVPKH